MRFFEQRAAGCLSVFAVATNITSDRSYSTSSVVVGEGVVLLGRAPRAGATRDRAQSAPIFVDLVQQEQRVLDPAPRHVLQEILPGIEPM